MSEPVQDGFEPSSVTSNHPDLTEGAPLGAPEHVLEELPRLSIAQACTAGEGHYLRQLGQMVRDHKGKAAVIDPHSGDYVVADDFVEALELFKLKFGERAQGFVRRVGAPRGTM